MLTSSYRVLEALTVIEAAEYRMNGGRTGLTLRTDLLLWSSPLIQVLAVGVRSGTFATSVLVFAEDTAVPFLDPRKYFSVYTVVAEELSETLWTVAIHPEVCIGGGRKLLGLLGLPNVIRQRTLTLYAEETALTLLLVSLLQRQTGRRAFCVWEHQAES